MAKALLVAVLAVAGFMLLGSHTLVGVALLATAAGSAFLAFRSARGPAPLPPPTAHSAARAEARSVERRARAEARRNVNRAVQKADTRGRAAIAVAQERLAAEAQQKWGV